MRKDKEKMETQIFLMGGNPPIKNHTVVNKIVSSRKIERIVIFTVYRENWEPYMKKYTEVFRSQCPHLNTDYLLLDTEQINFDSYLDADLIIIGGGNTEKYLVCLLYTSKCWGIASKFLDQPFIRSIPKWQRSFIRQLLILRS